jgi:hypothetical protein
MQGATATFTSIPTMVGRSGAMVGGTQCSPPTMVSTGCKDAISSVHLKVADSAITPWMLATIANCNGTSSAEVPAVAVWGPDFTVAAAHSAAGDGASLPRKHNWLASHVCELRHRSQTPPARKGGGHRLFESCRPSLIQHLSKISAKIETHVSAFAVS